MTTHTVRPQLAQPALIAGLDNIDWGQFHQVLGVPCQGCGRWHRGLLLGDGVGRCEHCGHASAMTKPQPKPEPEKRRPPVQRAAVIQRRPISTPRPRERGARMVAASGRHGTGRDDGSGSSSDDGDGDGGGGDGPPISRLRISAGRET